MVEKSENDLIDEIKMLIKGKTLDAIIPSFVYVIANRFTTLPYAVVFSIISAIIIGIVRVRTKGSLKYLAVGVLGVVFASSIALISKNASSFFLPKLLTSIGLALISIISLIIKKPLVAWLSHLSRGWDINWFWRPDVRPAYSEVTLLWLILFCFRGVLQAILLIKQNIEGLFIVNTLLGTPITIIILATSYVYGIWRLKKLGGPSVDEFKNNSPKPWKGQTKGF